MKVPSGTPVTSATVRPQNIRVIAPAALFFATGLVAMVETIEKHTPNSVVPMANAASVSAHGARGMVLP
jgi:hypothetical protein